MRRYSLGLIATVLVIACDEPPLAPVDGPLFGHAPNITIGGCEFHDINSTWELQGDCTTTEIIQIPDGYTLEGNGFTIATAAGGSFPSGVIQRGIGGIPFAHSTGHVRNVNLDATATPGVAGIFFGPGVHGSIQANTVKGTTGMAIFLENVCHVLVANNVLLDRGFYATGARSLIIRANDLTIPPNLPTHKHGIRLDSQLPFGPVWIWRNTVRGGSRGIYLAESTIAKAFIYWNRLLGNEFGIQLEITKPGAEVEIKNNTVDQAEQSGIHLASVGAGTFDLENNVISNSEQYGLALIGVQGSQVVAKTNVISDAAKDGIFVDQNSKGNQFIRNTMTGSVEFSCRDASQGDGTNGTGNTWDLNSAQRPSSPVGICGNLGRDWGDAPGAYPTRASQNGASHAIGSLFLGSEVDDEADGQPNYTSTGDDLNGATPDDEDGVTFTSPLGQNTTASVDVVASQAGQLNAWIDFNRNAIWEASEQIFTDEPLVGGTNNLTFAVPSGASNGTTWARFRLDAGGGLAPTGPAPDGEVEDYQLTLGSLDFGDAPGVYPTRRSQNGARHYLGSLYLGAAVDGEVDGQPNVLATGDDRNGATPDDEDGVTLPAALTPGTQANVTVVASTAGGLLNAWVDFNRNGIWEASEQVFTNQSLAVGANALTINVPAGASPGTSWARFRVDTGGGLLPTGLAGDGEVEDYRVEIG